MLVLSFLLVRPQTFSSVFINHLNFLNHHRDFTELHMKFYELVDVWIP